MKGAEGELSWLAWKLIGINEWPGPIPYNIEDKVCRYFPKTCEFIKAWIAPVPKDPAVWQKFGHRLPGNAAFKQIVHFAQLIDAAKF